MTKLVKLQYDLKGEWFQLTYHNRIWISVTMWGSLLAEQEEMLLEKQLCAKWEVVTWGEYPFFNFNGLLGKYQEVWQPRQHNKTVIWVISKICLNHHNTDDKKPNNHSHPVQFIPSLSLLNKLYYMSYAVVIWWTVAGLNSWEVYVLLVCSC